MRVPDRSRRAPMALALIFAALGASGLHAADYDFERLVTRAAGILTPSPSLDGFVHYEDDGTVIRFDGTVSNEPIASRIVRKIAYGRITEIVVATTPTGTYSSDAVTSPHTRYPGVTVTRPGYTGFVRYLEDGRWLVRTGPGARSVLTVRVGPGSRLVVTEDSRCLSTPTLLTCV
ncbi:hypothetical protein EMQ25_09675 [Arsenicitalea aurantiaca]|uniref:Uncharacterized protein n=1 Tax=Arsenicitalea aurantiaca TaxID=1783274 RepID=A0A433XAK7_9HYPH|nr:hypothetical protein [Arsenicitalea aurantiaca]RUT31131.1 hypothetical protein EMQ25_09675 [Arsenicitalea aurantiaca]